MKKTIIALLLAAPLNANAVNTLMPIIGVIDGDTIKSKVNLPCPLCNVSIRIRGIDTAESGWRAKCTKESEIADKAKSYLKHLVNTHSTMMIIDPTWDKYGGRIDAYVEVGGINLGQALIEKGLARPYEGSGPKYNWCS